MFERAYSAGRCCPNALPPQQHFPKANSFVSTSPSVRPLPLLLLCLRRLQSSSVYVGVVVLGAIVGEKVSEAPSMQSPAR